MRISAPAVEPDKVAVTAGVDDDVAGAGVEMGIHAAVALGALNAALQVTVVWRGLDSRLVQLAPEGIDQV